MTVVVDASVVVAALIDDGGTGRWAESVPASDSLAAPHLMPVEAANVLCRAAANGGISDSVASLAHADLLDLPVDLFRYAGVPERAWELRGSITSYDASYVALAEALDAPLATLDPGLTRASGPRCTFVTPP